MKIEIAVPSVGESITEVEIGAWLKQEGDEVRKDEPLVSLESEKATLELPAPESGRLAKILKGKGQVAGVGEVIASMEVIAAQPKSNPAAKPETGTAKSAPAPASAVSPSEPVRVMPAAQRMLEENTLRAEEVQATGPGGRLLKEDVLRHLEAKSSVRGPTAKSPENPPPPTQPELPPLPSATTQPGREEETVPMSRLRRTIADRLVEAQNTAALLTTFNEIDMGGVMELRQQYGEAFHKKYDAKLGFMSFFVKACVDALRLFPVLNAEVRGNSIVFHNFFDIGIAVGSGKGLVVPVLRNAERMSFAEIEIAIGDFGKRAKENKLKLDELQGGTFTVSNGGVYGSLLSTPIVNPPQSGVLGLHAIQDRPVARGGTVVIRPMMYVALTYDHRIVDGREAVSFLKRIKDVIETPARMLMEV
jgi:2-oxoglutarate dehydrogenase E2 component (dihydrolipoamide succinyltransferase)